MIPRKDLLLSRIYDRHSGKDLLLSQKCDLFYFNLNDTQSYFQTLSILNFTLGFQAIRASGLGLNPRDETKISLVVNIANTYHLGKCGTAYITWELQRRSGAKAACEL